MYIWCGVLAYIWWYGVYLVWVGVYLAGLMFGVTVIFSP